MRCTPWLLSLSLLAPLATGCSSDPDPVVSNKDASVSGVDAGSLDAAVGMDAEPVDLGPCNQLTGGNCATEGDICYFDTQLEVGVCRIPMGAPLGANEEACALGTNDCSAGLHCLNIPDVGPICLQNCATNNDCANVTGAGMNGYFCQEFNFGLTPNPKFCLPRPATCDIFEQMCPMNGNCAVINNDLDLGCIPTGTVAPGGGCQNGPCAKGGQCFDLNMTGQKCYAVCDATHACPMGAGQCAMTNPPLPWGGLCVTQ